MAILLFLFLFFLALALPAFLAIFSFLFLLFIAGDYCFSFSALVFNDRGFFSEDYFAVQFDFLHMFIVYRQDLAYKNHSDPKDYKQVVNY